MDAWRKAAEAEKRKVQEGRDKEGVGQHWRGQDLALGSWRDNRTEESQANRDLLRSASWTGGVREGRERKRKKKKKEKVFRIEGSEQEAGKDRNEGREVGRKK